jgi:hypothetical protein
MAQAFDLAGIINCVCPALSRSLRRGGCHRRLQTAKLRHPIPKRYWKNADPDPPALKQARPSTLSYGSQVLQPGQFTKSPQ